jgi:hypothetical protein
MSPSRSGEKWTKFRQDFYLWAYPISAIFLLGIRSKIPLHLYDMTFQCLLRGRKKVFTLWCLSIITIDEEKENMKYETSSLSRSGSQIRNCEQNRRLRDKTIQGVFINTQSLLLPISTTYNSIYGERLELPSFLHAWSTVKHTRQGSALFSFICKHI